MYNCISKILVTSNSIIFSQQTAEVRVIGLDWISPPPTPTHPQSQWLIEQKMENILTLI